MAGPLRPEVLSVVVVDDGDGLEPALTSLRGVGVVEQRLEVVAVGPGAALAGDAVDVPVEATGKHVGVLRNLGAAAAGGQYLCFVSGSLAVPDGVVATLLAQVERDPSAGAAGVGARTGAAVLAVPAHLCVVRTAVFRQAGGFAEELGGVLDDADLGWRVNLLGYRVRTVAADVVLPTPAVDETAFAVRRLSVAYRNLSDESLSRLLPAALAGAGPHAAAQLEALQPVLQEGRDRIQALRRRSDDELLGLVVASDLDLPFDDEVLRETGGADLLRGRRRVLVVTGDTLGEQMAGPAIRAWEMAHALADEHEVVLAALGGCSLRSDRLTARSVEGDDLRELEDWCDLLVFQGFLLRDHPWLVQSSKVLVADVYDPMHLEVLEQDKHRPMRHRLHTLRDSVETLNAQLLRADFILCASTRQRDLWLGQLAGLGRINPATYDGDGNLDELLAVVPFGTSAQPPVHRRPAIRGVVDGIGPDDTVLLWGGGIYNWFDPLTLLRAVDRLRHHRPDVRLYFLGTKHPNPMVPAMRTAAAAREVSDQLGLTGRHVFFNDDWVPYDHRQSFLLEADIGVSCHYDHIETAFSFRTRILDYLWAGLPIVTTGGDVFGDLVESRGLGVTVPAEDVVALEAALLRLLEDEAFAAACRQRVRDVAEDYTWDRVLEPLLRFCRAPHPARDRVPVRPDPTAGLPGPVRSVRGDLARVAAVLRREGPAEVLRRARRRVTEQRDAARLR